MKKFNKTSAAVAAGAIVTLIGAFFTLTPEQLGAVQTLLTALAVFVVPNGE